MQNAVPVKKAYFAPLEILLNMSGINHQSQRSHAKELLVSVNISDRMDSARLMHPITSPAEAIPWK